VKITNRVNYFINDTIGCLDSKIFFKVGFQTDLFSEQKPKNLSTNQSLTNAGPNHQLIFILLVIFSVACFQCDSNLC
jgi:hypothetical protein